MIDMKTILSLAFWLCLLLAFGFCEKFWLCILFLALTYGIVKIANKHFKNEQ